MIYILASKLNGSNENELILGIGSKQIPRSLKLASNYMMYTSHRLELSLIALNLRLIVSTRTNHGENLEINPINKYLVILIISVYFWAYNK